MTGSETPKHRNSDSVTVTLTQLEQLAESLATTGGGFGRVCAVCGTAFVAKHPGARYCSAACKQKAYRERKRKREPVQVVR